MNIINLPKNLVDALEVRAKEKGFSNAEAYIQMVLGEVVKKLGESRESNSMTRDDEDIVRDRLRRLGYID